MDESNKVGNFLQNNDEEKKQQTKYDENSEE